MIPQEIKQESVPHQAVSEPPKSLVYIQEEGVWIGNVLANSPAFEAGFNIGDKIIEVDGVAVTGIEQVKEKFDQSLSAILSVKVLRKSMFGDEESLSL